MDESALDSLIDTLGGSEEDVAPRPVYTGPEITVFSAFQCFGKFISKISLQLLMI